MSGLFWTTQKPQRQGWYWVRYRGLIESEHKAIVKCEARFCPYKADAVPDMVRFAGELCDIDDPRFIAWAKDLLDEPES